jgi:uncharacterized protein involved in outer membrane biogenesis
MKKKILIIVLSLVVVIGVALGIVAANLDKIVNARKGDMLAQAKARTGREVSVGDVGVAFWPGVGVSVSDVVVGDDPAYSAEPFVRAKELRVNVKLLPLFKRQLVIKRLVLTEPTITVIKGDGGRFNFTSLAEALAPPSAGKKASAGAGAAAVVAFADIEDGTVRYVDRASGLDHSVGQIDFEVEDARLGAVVKARVAAAVFSADAQDVRIEASVGPVADSSPESLAKAPVTATLELARVAFSDLMKFAPAAKTPPPPGDVEASATLSGTLGAASLDELRVRATLFGASEPNAEVVASAGPFDLLADSTQVFAAARLKGTLSAGPVPLSALKLPRPDPKAPAAKLGGEASAHASFDGALAAVDFTGEVDATAASISQPPQFEKAAGVPAKATVKGTFHPAKTPREGIQLTSIDVVLHALKATGSGRFVPFKGREVLDLSFKGRTAIAPWKDLMPALAPFAPSGDAEVAIKVSGMPKPGNPPKVTGTARFSNVGAAIPQVPQPLRDGKGSVAFTAKTASLSDATFTIGKSAFRIDGTATAFKPLAATYTLTSPEVWRADVQAAAPNAPKLPRPEVFREVSARGRMVEKSPQVVENLIDLSSKSGVVSNIDYTDLSATLRVTPATTVIDQFTAKAMGGTVSGKGTLEPKASKFALTTKVEKVNLADYFRSKSPTLADVLVGRIDADLTLTGAGKTWEDLQHTLVGEGAALVLDGAFLNVNVMKQITAAIQNLPMVPPGFTSALSAKNPKLFSENKTAFQKLNGKVTIANGKVQAPGLKLVTPDFTLDGTGWFSFGKEMDINSTLTLSEKMTNDIVAQVPMAKYLLSPQGRLEAPFALKGAIMKPIVSVDAAALTARAQQSLMQNAAKEGMREGVQDLLKGLDKKKPAPKAPADTSKVRPR